MDVDSEPIPEATFADCLARLPQVCIEVVVVDDGGVLLARRTNSPAAGEWFWPGGRLYKGERLEAGARRVAREELGLEVTVRRRLGVQEHFWDEASVGDVGTRHTVNVVFEVSPTGGLDVSLDDQHDGWRLLAEPDPDLHEYVCRYVERYDLL